MTKTVDERIVEARFDSKDFEKGVDKTIKKLDELKQSLNLKDSGKSITDFANDAEKGIEKAGNALERLSNRFTTFTGMLKQQIIGGLVNEISQAFISLERNIAGFVRSISSAQVSQGMNKYTEILNSVRTMTAAGVNQDIAYDKIKRLAEYSDQTSYSLSQMTSGMSKLVAAGMDVDKAEKSMEGLANMAASAGVNIYEAQRAFLNFSQAYGSGKMRIQDWTSFETLNMATEPVMKIFMEAAAQVGTLEKTVDKSGKEIYKTSKKVNKQIKAGKEVATSGFRDTLSYGWLDKATMEQATAVLSYFEDLKIDLNDLSDEELKNFATKAFQAAKEARSFADVMGTIKDVVATGWATSFEFIFGKLDKATEFFTWLTESNLADVIYGIGEFRNEVLSAWGADYLEGGIFHARDLEKGFLGTGRDLLIDALKNIDELIGSINEGIQSLFPETDVGWKQNLTFAQNLGYNLAMLTKQFRTATKNMLDFFTVEEEHNGEKKRVLKPEYVKVLESVGKIFGAIGKAAGAAFKIIGKLEAILGKTFARVLTTVQPVLDAIAGALGRIFDPISQLNENEGFFKSIQNAIDNLLIVIEPLMGPLSAFIGLLGELGSFFVSMTIDTIAMNIDLLAQALGFIIELFGGTSAQKANEGVGVIEGWANDIKAFGESCKEGFTAIKDFFASLFDDLKTLLGIGEKTEGQEGGFFDNIKNFFDTNEFVQKVKTWIDQAIIDIGNWIKGIPAKVSEFATNVGDFFHGLFWMKDENDPSKEVMTPLNAWLTQAIADVKEFFLDLPNKIADGIKNVGSFFEQLWNSLFYEEKVDKHGKKTRVKKPLKEWLDQALIDVGNFIKNIPEYVKMGIKGAGNILRTLIGALFGKKDGEEVTGNDIINTLKKPFEGITFTSILTKIKEIGREIANQIISLFTGTDDWESNKNTLATSVSAGIDWIRKKAEEAWPAVRDWFINLPTEISKTIQGLFGVGEEVEKPIQESIEGEKGPIQTALEDFGKSVGKFIEDLPRTIVNFFNTAITEISKLWGMLWKALRGEGEPQAELDKEGKVVEKAVNEAAPDAAKATSKWEEFTTNLGQTVSNLFSKLPTFITQGLDGAVILINKALTGLDELLKADNAKQEAKKAGKDAAENAVEETAEGTEDADAKALTEAIHAFGSDLKTLISDKIPTFISDGWTAVKNHAPEWWGIVNTWFDGYDISGLKAKVTEISSRIENVIRDMPDLISTAAAEVKKKFEKKSPLQKAQEEIEKAFTDENGNIVDVNGYRKALQHAAEVLSDVPEESAIWKSIKGIGSAIGDAFVKIGPDIMNGINGAITWIGNGIGKLTEWFSGFNKAKAENKDLKLTEYITGKIDEDPESKEYAAIWEAAQNIGKNILNIFTTVIPGFISEAFTTIGNTLPGFISNLFGGGNSGEADAAGEEAGTQIGNTTAQALTSSFQSTLDKKSSSLGSGLDLFGWLIAPFVPGIANAAEADGAEAMIEELKMTINNLDKGIENSEEALEKQNKINEIQEKLKAAREEQIEAAKTGNKDDLQRIVEDIEKYNKELEELGAVENDIAGNGGQSQQGNGQKAAEKVDVLKMILGKIAGLFDMLTDVDTLKTGGVILAVVAIMWALKTIVDNIAMIDDIGYTLKWAGITAAILGIVGFIGYLVYLMETAQEDKLQRIKDAFNTLQSLIITFTSLLTAIKSANALGSGLKAIGSFLGGKVYNSTITNNITKGTFTQGLGQGLAGVLGSLVNALGTGGYIWLILESLPKIIESITEAKSKLKAAGADQNIGDEMFKILGGVATVLSSVGVIGLAFAAIQKISPTGLDPAATASTIISLTEIIAGAVVVVNAIEGMNALLKKYVSEDADIYAGFENIGKTVASIISSLGEGIGGFIYGLTHGESKEKQDERNQEALNMWLDKLAELSKDMPMDQLETLISLTERMVGMYERLKALGGKADNIVIASATDIATTFRTIAHAVLEILTAFDAAQNGQEELYKMFVTTVNPHDFFGGDRNAFTPEDFAQESEKAWDLASRDYSIWESFTPGGAAFEAVEQFITLMSEIFGSLSDSLSPNIFNVLTLRDNQYTEFWKRLQEFFDEGGFTNMLGYVKSAYSAIENSYNELKPYTDSKYSNIIDIINNLFSIFTNLMPEGELAAKVLTGTGDEYKDWYFRIRNMLDWGPSGNKNDFEDLIQRVVHAYEILGKYDSQLSGYKNMHFIDAINDIFSVFGMFSQDNGIGSDAWLDNYNEFKKKLNESGFLENYVKDVEKIFEAFKTSSLFDPETGMMGNIYFDGSSIVKGLFDAINTGLTSSNLPELDATPIGDAILKAINISDTELKIAKKVHEMIQEGLLTFSKKPELGAFDTTGLTGYTAELQGLLDLFNGSEGDQNFFASLFGDETSMNQMLEQMKQFSNSMSLETMLGETPEEFIQNAQQTLGSAFTYVDPETNEQVDLIGKVEDTYSRVEEILGGFSTLGLTAGKNLDQGIATGINTGLAISAAQQLATAIEAAINDQDIHPKITPVIEIDDETMKTLELFDQNGTGTFRFSTSGMSNDANAANPNLYETIPDYSEILNTISGTLSTISGSSSTTVETSLDGVRVVLDSGALVGALIGEIDTILARRGFYAEREG